MPKITNNTNKNSNGVKKTKYTIVAVATIDGKIAKNSRHNVNWSSKEDKIFLNQKIAEHDVIIVGKNTFKVAKKALTKKEFSFRRYIVFTRSIKTTEKESEQVIYTNPKNVNIKKLVAELGYKKVCILGGTQIYSLMLKKSLVDEIFLTIEPIVFGTGLSLFEGKLPNTRFKLISSKQLNKKSTILLHYKV